jgi:hypothetical protein
LLAVLAAIVVPARPAAAAIAADYVRASLTDPYQPITPDSGASSLAFANANDGTAPIGLPFAFAFDGHAYPAGTILTVCVNGWATLTPPTILAVAADNFQLYGGQRHLMAPWWDDLSADVVGTNPAGGVLHHTLGPPGARRLVIQWTGVSAWKDLSGGQPRTIDFQLVLEEGTNAIEFRYQPLGAGSYSTRESASSGLCGEVSVLDYLDAWTGSGRAGNGLITTNSWPARHLRLVPGTPAPVAPGNYEVGVGRDWPSLSEAIADLAHRGVSGRVTIRLTDARYDSTTNVFPLVLGPIDGASASHPVILRSLGTPAAIVLPRGSLTGGFLMTANFATFGLRGAHLFVVGADHVTVRNLDLVADPGVQVTAGIYVTQSHVDDGAQFNVFQDLRFDLPNGANGATAVFQRAVGATGFAGTCSGNQYLDLAIDRARAGIAILGTAQQPDEGIVIGAEAAAMTIGGTSPARLATSGSGATVAIQANNVRNLRIAGCEVRNVGNLGTGGAVGIRVDNSGLPAGVAAGIVEISGNRVHDLYGSTSVTGVVVGIGVSLGGDSCEARVFNNTVTELNSASVTGSRNVVGIRVQESGAGAGATHHVDFNSIRLEPISLGCSSAGLEVVNSTGPVVMARNNVVSNLSGTQTAPAAHYAIATSRLAGLAAPGSIADRNVLHIEDPARGFIGRDGAGDHLTLADWRAATGLDGASVAAPPGFVGPLDLHVDPGVPTPVEARGSTFGGSLSWVATDMDGEPRHPAAPDLGADEGAFLSTDRIEAAPASGASITLSTPCIDVPVVWHRADDTPARGYSVTVELSPGVVPCGARAVSAGYLAPGAAPPPYFAVTAGDSNRWTVDEVTLGAPCGATGTDTLFVLQLASVPDTGTAAVRIVEIKARDCPLNAPIFAVVGPVAEFPVEMPADWVAVEPAAGARITSSTPCVEVPVVWHRDDSTPARAYSVTVELDTSLALCGDLATSAGYLAPGAAPPPYFAVTAGDSSRWTIDEATLGLPCGSTGSDTLFRLWVTTAGTSGAGAGAIRVVQIKARDCDANAPIAAVAGPVAMLAFDRDGPAAVADLAAARVLPAPDADGTLPLRLTFSPPPGATSVQVWRRGFGGYPRYDDAGGAAPTTPGSPAAAALGGWTLTGATASGAVDDPPGRDAWHYVLFSLDGDGNASAPSNVAGGTPNYRLGDVHDGGADCTGDNRLDTPDPSFLGSRYGVTLSPSDPFACLDVGPTVDGTPDTRPLTDGVIGFDDLMILSLDFGLSGPPAAATAPGVAAVPPRAEAAALPEVAVEAPARVSAGDRFEARVALRGGASVRGLSVALAWDAAIAEPEGFEAGDALDGGVLLSPRAGAVDGARLGTDAAGAGEGTFARFRFRAIAAGDPRIAIAAADARDGSNRRLLEPAGGAIGPPAGPAAPAAPRALALSPPWPNPAHGAATLEFALPEPGAVALAVYSAAGRLVRTLAAGSFPAGVHRLAWDGAGADGRAAPPGLYWVRLSAPGGTRVRAIVRLR